MTTFRKFRLLVIIGGTILVCLMLSLRLQKKEKMQITHSEKLEWRRVLEMTNVSQTSFKSPRESSKLSVNLSIENTKIIKMALKISSENDFVMVTLINEAYIPFALSWLCNTKHMDIHQHVLFLTTDEKTDGMLKRHWPDVKSAILKGIDSKRNESYSQAGYVKLMVKRTEALLQILKENVAIFLFEVDCLWLRNPVQLLLSHTHVDIISTKVSNRPTVIAGGFLYLFPTKTTKILWEELTRRMLALYEKIRLLPPSKDISEAENDQQYLSALIMNKFKGIHVKLLPADEFPDGQWYSFSAAKRQTSKPYIINNNWIVGNSGKIKRAKEWKHWFIKEDNTCDEDNIALLNKQ